MDMMTSSHLFLFFCHFVIIMFPDSMVPLSKGLEYLRLYASCRLFDLSVRPGTYSV